MSSLAHEEIHKPCTFFCLSLKDAFAGCQTFCEKLSTSLSSSEDEDSVSDTDDEQEVVVHAIRTRAMEAKLRRRKGRLITESFQYWDLGLLFMDSKGVQHTEDNEDDEKKERESFLSAGSYLSCCSNASREAFYSVGSRLSRCSSSCRFEFWDARRRSILHEFSQCQGWPFGLRRKALLLPPLPRSPSESWSWSRGTRLPKMPLIL